MLSLHFIIFFISKKTDFLWALTKQKWHKAEKRYVLQFPKNFNSCGWSHPAPKIFKNELKLENLKCRLRSRSSVIFYIRPIITWCEDKPGWERVDVQTEEERNEEKDRWRNLSTRSFSIKLPTNYDAVAP